MQHEIRHTFYMFFWWFLFSFHVFSLLIFPQFNAIPIYWLSQNWAVQFSLKQNDQINDQCICWFKNRLTIESVLGTIQIISECKQCFERNERNERFRGWRNSNGNSLLYAWCMLHMFHRWYFLCTCTFHSIQYFHDMQFTCKYIRTLNISVLSSFFLNFFFSFSF